MNLSITLEFCYNDIQVFTEDISGCTHREISGGGVLLAVKKFVKPAEVNIFDNDLEAMCIRVRLSITLYFLL